MGKKVFAYLNELLYKKGKTYFAVPRDIPRTGKLGINHSLQNYIILTLPSIYSDDSLEIYQWEKDTIFKDKTKDYISLRDKRKDK